MCIWEETGDYEVGHIGFTAGLSGTILSNCHDFVGIYPLHSCQRNLSNCSHAEVGQDLAPAHTVAHCPQLLFDFGGITVGFWGNVEGETLPLDDKIKNLPWETKPFPPRAMARVVVPPLTPSFCLEKVMTPKNVSITIDFFQHFSLNNRPDPKNLPNSDFFFNIFFQNKFPKFGPRCAPSSAKSPSKLSPS